MSKYAEIHMQGNMTAKGSNNVLTNFSFYFIAATGFGTYVKSNIEAAFQASIAAPICAALNARWAQTQNTVRFFDDPTDAPIGFPETTPGAITGDSMPSNVAAFVLLKTPLRGRSYRGSKHFGPLSESDTTTGTDDLLNAAAIARFQTICSAIVAGFTDSDSNIWSPYIFSRTLSGNVQTSADIKGAFVVQANLNKRLGRLAKRQVKSVY